jgi:hypothetical protein
MVNADHYGLVFSLLIPTQNPAPPKTGAKLPSHRKTMIELTQKQVDKLDKELCAKAKEFRFPGAAQRALSGDLSEPELKPLNECLRLKALLHLMRQNRPYYFHCLLENDLPRQLSYHGHPEPYTLGQDIKIDYPEFLPYQVDWVTKNPE